jgi:hypothetical protein
VAEVPAVLQDDQPGSGDELAEFRAQRMPQMTSYRPAITRAGTAIEPSAARSSMTSGTRCSSRLEMCEPPADARSGANSCCRPQ